MFLKKYPPPAEKEMDPAGGVLYLRIAISTGATPFS